MYFAFSGENRLGSRVEDWKQAFRSGFGIDLMFRTNPKARARDTVAGDRRIVLTKEGSQWIAVLYDYESNEAGQGEGLEFNSPVAQTKIARVVKLPAHAFKMMSKDDTLEMDPLTLGDSLEGVGETPTLPGGKVKPQITGKPKDAKTWTAELFLPWTTLGITTDQPVRCDVGILSPTADQAKVESAAYWSNRYPNPLGDAAVETMLNPGAWGYIRFR
jgi:hypothetical protein